MAFADETTFMRRMPNDELLARRPDLVGLPWAGRATGACCLNFCTTGLLPLPLRGDPWDLEAVRERARRRPD